MSRPPLYQSIVKAFFIGAALGALFAFVTPDADARPIDGRIVNIIPAARVQAAHVFGHDLQPACGTPSITFEPGDQVAAEIGGGVPAGQVAAGVTLLPLELCAIHLNVEEWREQLSPGQKCVLVMHELGHAYGLGHSAKGVMAPAAVTDTDWQRVPACRRIFKGARFVDWTPGIMRV